MYKVSYLTLTVASLVCLFGVYHSPVMFRIKAIISCFSIVPEPSSSNSMKHYSNSSSLIPFPPVPMSPKVFLTNWRVSSLSRDPELSSSYSCQISCTHLAMTTSMSEVRFRFLLRWRLRWCLCLRSCFDLPTSSVLTSSSLTSIPTN